MRLLVGLGNPGARYAKNRHNIGFVTADSLARRYGFSPYKSRFKGLLAEGVIASEKRLLLKPQTYMNDSGESVGAVARFFKLASEEILVFHDDIDLRPGKVRAKLGGGSAGHNGLRSIDAVIGSLYWRVRLGVGHPGVKELVYPYVLQDFSREEIETWAGPAVDAVVEALPLLLRGSPDAFMSEVARLSPPPVEKNE